MTEAVNITSTKPKQPPSRVTNEKSKYLTRSITIELTESAFATVMAEAKIRSWKPATVALAALLDFLGRKGQTPGAKSIPLSIPFHWRIREMTVAAAQARGVSVTQYLMYAAICAANRDATADDIRTEIGAAIHTAGVKSL